MDTAEIYYSLKLVPFEQPQTSKYQDANSIFALYLLLAIYWLYLNSNESGLDWHNVHKFKLLIYTVIKESGPK